MEKKYHISVFAAFLILVLSVSTVHAVVYVDADASAGGNGASWATAYKYLKDALGSNREIWVAAGTYYPDQSNANPTGTGSRTSSFAATTNCKVYGGFDGIETSRGQRNIWRNETILSGDIGTVGVNTDNAYHVIKNSYDTGFFDGFTITRGYADVYHDPGYVDDRGAGAFGGGVFTNCLFTNNTAYHGSDVCGDMTLVNCRISSSGYLSPGSLTGMIDRGNGPTAIGCLITNKIELYHGPATFINCTMSNIYLRSEPDYTWDYLDVYLANCIVQHAYVTGISGDTYTYPATLYVNYSNVVSNSVSGPGASIDWGVGNVAGSTQFESGYGNYNLSASSPCLDAGSNDEVPADNWDLDGDGDTAEKLPMEIAFKERFIDDPAADVGSGMAPLVDMGAFERARRLYVDLAAPSSGNGLSWDEAYKYLHDAIGAATVGTEIWVAQGYYQTTAGGGYTWNDRNARYELKNDVGIYGGFYGNEVQFDQRDWETYQTHLTGSIGLVGISDDSYHVIWAIAKTPSARLDGFTIAYGNANGTDSTGSGGGVYTNSSPTFANCVFKNNVAAYYGGAVYNGNADFGGPVFLNCKFLNNYAFRGGGVYTINESTTTFTNCMFSGNDAYYGGAIHQQSSADSIITNTSFYSNTAVNYGGAVNAILSVVPTVRNSVFWGNSAPNGPQMALADSDADIRYSDLEGGQPAIDLDGTCAVTYLNCLSENPLFADPDGADNTIGTIDDDLRLTDGSPCIDAGDNGAVPAGVTTDLDGNNRFLDDFLTPDTGSGSPPIVDMGAFEFVQSIPILYVDKTASGLNNGTNWTNAFNELSDALAAAVSGNAVWVAEGTYKPDPAGVGDPRDATFQLVNGISIYGGFPAGGGTWSSRAPATNETILSGDLSANDGADFVNYGENCRHVVTGSGTDATAILDGFIITAGNASDIAYPANSGGGLYNLSGSPMIHQCIFRYNLTESRGGAVFNQDSTAAFNDCAFIGNKAATGGAANNAYTANTTFINCLFESNTSSDAGGAVQNVYSSHSVFEKCIFRYNHSLTYGGAIRGYACSPKLINCIFENNTADLQGGAVWHNTSSHMKIWGCLFINNLAPEGGACYSTTNCNPQIINSTFSGNSAIVKGGAIQIKDTCNLTLKNSILWDNNAPAAPQIGADNNCTITAQYSDIDGGQTDILLENSSTVSSYTNNLNTDPKFVIPGFNFRPMGGSSCIDAADNSAIPAELTEDLDGHTRKIDDPMTADTGSGSAPIVDMGAYELGSVIYVDSTASGSNNGTSWINAFQDLQDALDAAGTNNIILVAAGSYYPDEGLSVTPGDRNTSFQLKNGVALYGGFAAGGSAWASRNPTAYVTILSGDLNQNDTDWTNMGENSYHVVNGTGTDETAMLNGFTIQRGYANGGYHPANKGGGLYNNPGSPTITQCRFYHNSALGHRGGGVFNMNGSHPKIAACSFEDNYAGDGGGLTNEVDCSPVIYDCSFSGNIATIGPWTPYSGIGGAIHNRTRSSPLIERCTFVNNQSGDDAGAILNYQECYPVIKNCIFSGNVASDKAGALYDRNSSGSLVYNSTFYNNSAAYGGAVYTWQDGGPDLENCILWANTAAYGSQVACDSDSQVSIRYCDVQSGLAGTAHDGTSSIIWGLGNIAVDPLFANPASGDFHLKSEGWRFNPVTQSWTFDAQTSRCADAGCPGYPCTSEDAAVPSGYGINLRINMGTYGGTEEASKPPYDWALLSDINNDGISNLIDFAEFSVEWSVNGEKQPCDFDRDGTVELDDLVLMAQDFLTQTDWH